MVSVFEKHPDVGLVFAKYHIIGEFKKHIYNYIFPQQHFSQQEVPLALEADNIIGCPLNVMHRKECIRKAGTFSKAKTLTTCSYEDWDFWLRISDFYKIYHLDSVLAKYVYHSVNRSKTINSLRAFIYIIKKRIKKYQAKGRLEQYACHLIFASSVRLLQDRDQIDHWHDLKNRLLALEKGITRQLLSTYCVGVDHYLRGEFFKAEGIFRMTFKRLTTRKHPDHVEVKNIIVPLKFLWARCEEELQHYRRAVRLHEEILVHDRWFFLSKERLPLLYFKLGNYKKALSLARSVPSGLLCNMQGVYYMKKKRYRKALYFFKKARSVDPLFIPALQNLQNVKQLYS
jgi:tetratricopeptide (TPR) repeat protein